MTDRCAVKVAVDTVTTAIDKPYDYRVPPKLEGMLQPGARVLVPFGQGSRLREGIVLSAPAKSDAPRLKEINALLDETPVLDSSELKMALWLRERYFCTLYDAVRVILPHGVWYSLSTVWRVTAPKEEAYAAAGGSKLRSALLDMLFSRGGKATLKDIRAAFSGKDLSQQARELEKAGVLAIESSASRSVKDKTAEIATLAVSPEAAMDFYERRRKAAPGQAEAARVISEIGSATVKELASFTGASTVSVRGLAKHGIIKITDREVLRIGDVPEAAPPKIELSADQTGAYNGLLRLMDLPGSAAALLQGVTGSGKTLVYISLVREALARGKTAIVLVPEIALTPGLLSVFARHFGRSVAVLHSALSTAERYDQWKRIKYRDEVKVVLGTRSAVFAPLKNLGLIVLDEEQETSYKSENMPCYHARDVAKYRCVAENALLVLGSATPSLETRYFAETGRYRYFTLPGRFGARPLPKVIIADMKKELSAGNPGTISSLLKAEIDKNLAAGEQTILFINRRGNSRLKACGECGAVRTCPNCSVAMTYHSTNDRLMCHYCGHSEPFSARCTECGGLMKLVGAGTQKVELELHELFPGVETIRMDADTVGAIGSHDRILRRFEKEKIPILIGTQMVTKGLDFANVTLVGVLAADLSLYSDDFRAYERSFSLMTQVVGRAGRGTRPGRAVIQTFTPNNEVILAASRQDYEAFYAGEVAIRRAQGFPPFSDMVYITASGPDRQEAFMAAAAFRQRLEQVIEREYTDLAVQLLGPAPLSVAMVNNKHRFRTTLLLKNDAAARRLIGAILKEIKSDRRFGKTSVYADVD